MVSRRTNFGERSEPAPDRGGKLQSAGGGAAQSNVSPLISSLRQIFLMDYYRKDWSTAVSFMLLRFVILRNGKNTSQKK